MLDQEELSTINSFYTAQTLMDSPIVKALDNLVVTEEE